MSGSKEKSFINRIMVASNATLSEAVHIFMRLKQREMLIETPDSYKMTNENYWHVAVFSELAKNQITKITITNN